MIRIQCVCVCTHLYMYMYEILKEFFKKIVSEGKSNGRRVQAKSPLCETLDFSIAQFIII